MTLLEIGFVVTTFLVAVVGAALGHAGLGPLGAAVGALAPLPLWLGLRLLGASLTRRHQRTRLAPARVHRRSTRRGHGAVSDNAPR